MNTEKEQRAVLAINGSDGTGASGIQAHIRTIQSLGGTPLTAITTITMQNTLGIQEFYDLPAPLSARRHWPKRPLPLLKCRPLAPAAARS